MKKEYKSYYQILVERKESRYNLDRLRRELSKPLLKKRKIKSRPRQQHREERSTLRTEFFERFEHYLEKE